MRALYVAIALTIPVGASLAGPATLPDPPVLEATSLTEEQLREAITGKTIYFSMGL